MTAKQIIQIIPQQYMPKIESEYIVINTPGNSYFKPEEISIEDKPETVEISIGHSFIILFKNTYKVLTAIYK